MNKNIPNILSIIRIVFSFLLLLTQPFSPVFFILYLVCGLSDGLDGFIARKFKLTSELGAVLDSIGDFFMIVIVMYLLYPYINLTNHILLWILVIMGIRISSLIVAFIKYHTLAFLHTYANKAAGFLLFCFPIFYVSVGLNNTAVGLCIIATVSAVEELLIQLKSKELNRNVISIFKL
jgi:CDP-diacylglycerol--glycerol-3-phosphate 3-phosphatidyltransferase